MTLSQHLLEAKVEGTWPWSSFPHLEDDHHRCHGVVKCCVGNVSSTMHLIPCIMHLHPCTIHLHPCITHLHPCTCIHALHFCTHAPVPMHYSSVPMYHVSVPMYLHPCISLSKTNYKIHTAWNLPFNLFAALVLLMKYKPLHMLFSWVLFPGLHP